MRKIAVYSDEDFACMRKAGKLAAHILDYIEPFVKPGVTTGELNDLCHEEIVRHGAIPAPLNYMGFPKSICTSVNDVVCHGIPSYTQKLNEGDIINIDVTVILDGWHGDTSRTLPVGQISPNAQKLIDVTYDAMMSAIQILRPGIRLGDIGEVIKKITRKHRFSIVRDYCGHGIGREFHEDPTVLHHAKGGTGPLLQKGNIFTVEPMINVGDYGVRVLKDGWTAVTADGSLSAQFEHTVGITEDGFEIFT